MPTSKKAKGETTASGDVTDEAAPSRTESSPYRPVPQPPPAPVRPPGELTGAAKEAAYARYAAEAEWMEATNPDRQLYIFQEGDLRAEAKLFEVLMEDLQDVAAEATAVEMWAIFGRAVRSIVKDDIHDAKRQILEAFKARWEAKCRAKSGQPGGTTSHRVESLTEGSQTRHPAGVAKQEDKKQSPRQRQPEREAAGRVSSEKADDELQMPPASTGKKPRFVSKSDESRFAELRRKILSIPEQELSTNPLYSTPLFRAREAAGILDTTEDALRKQAKSREMGRELNERRLFSVKDLSEYLKDPPKLGRPSS